MTKLITCTLTGFKIKFDISLAIKTLFKLDEVFPGFVLFPRRVDTLRRRQLIPEKQQDEKKVIFFLLLKGLIVMLLSPSIRYNTKTTQQIFTTELTKIQIK